MEDAVGAKNRFEIRSGIVLSIFASLLAVVSLYGGKYKDGQLRALNEKAAAFMWYQAKSIKETTIQGQMGVLESMVSAGALTGERAKATEAYIQKLAVSSERYKKEMKEILAGSKKVGKENWAQEVDGQMGRVIGANEWDDYAREFGRRNETLNSAALFLQLCLVVGAVSIVVQNSTSRRLFYYFMLGLGLTGTGIAAYGIL